MDKITGTEFSACSDLPEIWTNSQCMPKFGNFIQEKLISLPLHVHSQRSKLQPLWAP